jgi:hypothetical protein
VCRPSKDYSLFQVEGIVYHFVCHNGPLSIPILTTRSSISMDVAARVQEVLICICKSLAEKEPVDPGNPGCRPSKDYSLFQVEGIVYHSVRHNGPLSIPILSIISMDVAARAQEVLICICKSLAGKEPVGQGNPGPRVSPL